MKLIGSLLVTLGLVLGAFSAASAYVVRVEAVAPEDNLILHAPAGRDPANPDQPVLRPGTIDQPVILKETELQALQAAETEVVHVKEFSWSRWRGRWWFLLACVLLVAGAAFMRVAARQRLEKLVVATAESAVASPPGLLAEAIDRARGLLRDLEVTADPSLRKQIVIERIDGLHEQQLEPFVAARPQLIASLGMAGFAQLMDRFAAAERAINRAWSAAADDEEGEAVASLQRGLALLEETATRLPGQAAFEGQA